MLIGKVPALLAVSFSDILTQSCYKYTRRCPVTLHHKLKVSKVKV